MNLDLDQVIERVTQDLKARQPPRADDVAVLQELEARDRRGDGLSDHEKRALHAAKHTRTGNRFVSPHATAEHNERTAREKGADLSGGGQPVAWKWGQQGPSGSNAVMDVIAARKGDYRAHDRRVGGLGGKAWTEGSPTAGGYFVMPEELPDFLRKRKAAGPLRELCAQHTTQSDETWIVVEDGTVNVAFTPEGATKPFSQGSIAQKVAATFKLSGRTIVTDELLQDGGDAVQQLVSEQFAAQMAIQSDQAIISGTGVGEPTGIRVAAGINAVAVDGQSGAQLHASIVRALARLREKHHSPDELVCVLHPRDVVRVELQTDGGGSLMFPNGLEDALPCRVVLDSNIPVNLGGGTASIVIVGNFREGAAFIERSPMVLEASSDAGFADDTTHVRAVQRFGFAVTQPSAFELITGVLPS